MCTRAENVGMQNDPTRSVIGPHHRHVEKARDRGFKKRVRPGSLAALIATYYQSIEYTKLNASTKAVYRRILERTRDAIGNLDVASITRADIRALVSKGHGRPWQHSA